MKIKEFNVDTVCFLILFLVTKIALESLLTCTFIPALLSSEPRKKYTLRLLCLETLEERFSCFPGVDWEGISREVLSIVKLYQRI